MKITSIEMTPLHIPFQSAFAHSSASRSETESVLVRLETASGHVGLGEGCPRGYVTNESVETCLSFFSANYDLFSTITSLDELKTFVFEERSLIDSSPAAWCAIELALLDALAREHNQSVESLLAVTEQPSAFQYTAVVGAMKPTAFQALTAKYRAMGFADWKVKIGSAGDVDDQNLEGLSQSVSPETIRLDANNCWKNDQEAYARLEKLTRYCWAIEEPLTRGAYAELGKLSRLLSRQIILDESFSRIEQLGALSSEPWWIPNVRVSKMGGILRSLELLAAMGQREVILGCQVGETSILTRAALVCARALGARLKAQEGAFGTFLLEHEIVEPCLMFGAKGILSVGLSDPGFGLTLRI